MDRALRQPPRSRIQVTGYKPGLRPSTLGELPKILYIEPGTDLIVTYQRPGKSRTRTSFEGKGAAENTHLDTPTQLVSLQQDMTGEMVQKLLLDSVQTRQARLEASSSLPLSKHSNGSGSVTK